MIYGKSLYNKLLTRKDGLMLIQRIFLPVGQGAFYLEKHPNMNVIYDCGNSRKTKAGQKIVSQTLSKNDDIDILFISHFDYDHVSLISTLKKTVRKIKRVILPLLSPETINLLININRAVNNNTLTLIQNPKDFFGDDTIISYTSTDFNDQNTETTIDSLTNEAIINGKTILTSSLITYDWVFIPFNYKRTERLSCLEDELIKNGFDLMQLKGNPEYTVDAAIIDRKKIRDIYNKLAGKINENSMLIYSGPVKSMLYGNYIACDSRNMLFPLMWRIKYKHYPFVNAKSGCIYTGDSNLNNINISSVFSRVIDKVGIMQIPHHGDIKSYNSTLFKSYKLVCPISYGKNNTYGHPSTAIISDLLANECLPIHITEDVDSYFIQHIEVSR